MSATKMTPGPWIVSRGAQADPFSIEGPARTVAHIKTGMADARAIACLPELVEAARAIADFPLTSRTLGNLRRILARIEGEEA